MTQSRYADALDALDALDACVATTRRNLARLEGFPYWTEQGRWLTEQRGRGTGGHWLGIIWMAYLRTGDPALLDTCTPPANSGEEGLLSHQTGDLPHGNASDVS